MTRIERTERNLADFKALLVEYEHALPQDLRVPDLDSELEHLESAYESPSCAFVAYVDGQPAGCVALAHLDTKTAIVKRLFVKPAFRNRGVARTLLTEVIGFARERGYERLALDTHRDRLNAAYALYASFGFVECEPYERVHYSCPTFMELRLDLPQ